jgi:hypothetical protein
MVVVMRERQSIGRPSLTADLQTVAIGLGVTVEPSQHLISVGAFPAYALRTATLVAFGVSNGSPGRDGGVAEALLATPGLGNARASAIPLMNTDP